MTFISNAADETEQSAETRQWFDQADSLDYAARVLIRYCLAQAAQAAIDRSRKWVELAEAAGMQDDEEFAIFRIIIDEVDLLESKEPDDNARRWLEDRIKRLDDVKEVAESVASELRAKLKQPDSPERSC